MSIILCRINEYIKIYIYKCKIKYKYPLNNNAVINEFIIDRFT